MRSLIRGMAGLALGALTACGTAESGTSSTGTAGTTGTSGTTASATGSSTGTTASSTGSSGRSSSSSGSTGSAGTTSAGSSSGSGSSGSTGFSITVQRDGGTDRFDLNQLPNSTHPAPALWQLSASDPGPAHGIVIRLSNTAPDGGFIPPEPGTYDCKAPIGGHSADLSYQDNTLGLGGFFGSANDLGGCLVTVTSFGPVGGRAIGTFVATPVNRFQTDAGIQVSGSFDLPRSQ